MSPPDFFIGWDKASGRSLFGFLGLAAGIVLLGLAGLGALTGATLPDPSLGVFRLAPPDAPDAPIGDATLRGRVTLLPVPLLFVAPDASHPRGHTILLTGDGKRGPSLDAGVVDGAMISVSGLLLRRGTIDMLVMGDPIKALPEPPVAMAAPVSLGRWRIAGEICDGKCQTGAMQPGQGLSHRACASLCIEGGVPAVFVAVSPVAGTPFLLLAGPDGRPLANPARLAALRVVLEGEVERRGDVLVLKIDLDRATIL